MNRISSALLLACVVACSRPRERAIVLPQREPVLDAIDFGILPDVVRDTDAFCATWRPDSVTIESRTIELTENRSSSNLGEGLSRDHLEVARADTNYVAYAASNDRVFLVVDSIGLWYHTLSIIIEVIRVDHCWSVHGLAMWVGSDNLIPSRLNNTWCRPLVGSVAIDADRWSRAGVFRCAVRLKVTDGDRTLSASSDFQINPEDFVSQVPWIVKQYVKDSKK